MAIMSLFHSSVPFLIPSSGDEECQQLQRLVFSQHEIFGHGIPELRNRFILLLDRHIIYVITEVARADQF
jgi:hypothetical protein